MTCLLQKKSLPIPAFTRIASLLFILFIIGVPLVRAESFKRNLSSLVEQTNRTIEIIRNQILSNQSAPFLAELYLKLGEALSTKASLLYYQQMEKLGVSEGGSVQTKAMPAVVDAHKEAVEIYNKIIKEFPKFEKRKRANYLLIGALQAIDDKAHFLSTAQALIKEFPGTQEEADTRLLLGQYFFDRGIFEESVAYLEPVTRGTFDYEKNAAKYRLGLSYMAMEQAPRALKLFEEVIMAKAIKEKEASSQLPTAMKEKPASTLIREALLDSIKAYTTVFDKDPKPIEYYLKISPNEILFYEVIEKLSYRYVTLKRYDLAIELLRTLAKHISNPDKLIKMYRDVLVAIPIQDRIAIAPNEIRELLEKLSEWNNYYYASDSTQNKVMDFFERQVRDLGTRNHDLAKSESPGKKKNQYLTQAREFYILYLAYFPRTGNSLKMALNLGDVAYQKGLYLESSDYYLRASQNEFGGNPNKVEILQNVIAASQKDGDYSLYEQLRLRGVLVKAIQNLMATSDAARKSAQWNFLLLKTRFEQGAYRETIPKIYSFMRSYAASPYARAAGELVLDYYNTRKDYAGLKNASSKILSSGIKDAAFMADTKRIHDRAGLKKLDQKIKAEGKYDDFEQGKSYLQTALRSSDASLMGLALQQALSKSKAEGDFQTFFSAGSIIAKKETDPVKKADVSSAMSKEAIRISRFYQAIGLLKSTYENTALQKAQRASAFQDSVEISLILRDWVLLERLVQSSFYQDAPQSLRQKVNAQIANLLEAPVQMPRGLMALAFQNQSDDTILFSLYKSLNRFALNQKKIIQKAVEDKCSSNESTSLCRWFQVSKYENEGTSLFGKTSRTTASVSSIQQVAGQFSQLASKYDPDKPNTEPSLGILLSLKSFNLYSNFANYLSKAAKNAPDLKDVLAQRAADSLKTAKEYLENCQKIVSKSGAVTPANRFCIKGKLGSYKDMTEWQTDLSISNHTSDATNQEIISLQKQLFIKEEKDSGQTKLALAENYLKNGFLSHAAATASLSLASNNAGELENDYRTILGCALVQMGLLEEASFNLSSGSQYRGLKDSCQNRLKSIEGGL